MRVLDGDEEARLSFRSAVAHFDMGVGRSVIADIGGGSLELALSAEGVIERLGSLPFGAIRLTEEFLSDGITPKRVRRCGVRSPTEFASSCRAEIGADRS